MLPYRILLSGDKKKFCLTYCFNLSPESTVMSVFLGMITECNISYSKGRIIIFYQRGVTFIVKRLFAICSWLEKIPGLALVTIPVYHAHTGLSRLPLKNSGLSGACQNQPLKNSCSIHHLVLGMFWRTTLGSSKISRENLNNSC